MHGWLLAAGVGNLPATRLDDEPPAPESPEPEEEESSYLRHTLDGFLELARRRSAGPWAPVHQARESVCAALIRPVLRHFK